MASASPSTSYEIGNNHSPFDVFINHLGPDVKKGLASHIYHTLSRQGLRVFLDMEELQAGDNLTPQIEGAINTASVHIGIFSPRYAESSWCLNELVQMLETRKPIIPVFYKVNPSELRWKEKGDEVYTRSLIIPTRDKNVSYARALRVLEKKTTFDSQAGKQKPRYDSLTIEKWRNALSVVSNISGFELNACNGDEGLLVHKVVQQVLRKHGKRPLKVAKYPTGLHDKVKDFETTMLSQQQSEEITPVGIVGCGGVGKTTLAKELFNLYRSKYKESCFLSDVRENAAKGFLNGLQSTLFKELGQSSVPISSNDEDVEERKRRLARSARVLVVIDDVDHWTQLDALFSPIKEHFHPSSFILVTSRDMGLLKRSGIPESFIYNQTGLNQKHSQELFCLHAFNHPCPPAGFGRVVKKFLDVCGGLPLSLRVIGALLCHEDLHYWEEQFKKISKLPPSDILKTLKISYDSLDDEEKQIFLDAACFFIGEDRDTAIRIWDLSHWQGWLGLRNLENKCLLELDSENCIRMHDHLRDLGRYIAKKEIPHRLCWSDDIVYDNSPVRGISMVHGTDPAEIPANIRGLQLLRAEGNSVKRIFSVPQPPQPVWLRWDSCPYSSLPSWIQVKNLQVLHIQGGELETLPDEVCGMHSLKVLKLQGCRRLSFLPDSAGNWTNPEVINFSYCANMQALPDSAGNWTNLEVIDLSHCHSVQGLPDSAGNWTNLRDINLSDCSALQWLPDSAGNWTNLRDINLSECRALQGLPDSAGNWTNLRKINLRYCTDLQGLPDSVGHWTNLRKINLSKCFNLQGLFDSAGGWTNLREINLRKCYSLQGLPDSAGNWTNLEVIHRSFCVDMKGLPDSAVNWTNLVETFRDSSEDLDSCLSEVDSDSDDSSY